MTTGTKTHKENQKIRKICKQHHSLTQSASQYDKSISDRRTHLCVRAAYSQYRHENGADCEAAGNWCSLTPDPDQRHLKQD